MSYRIHKGKYYYELNGVFNKLKKESNQCFICGSKEDLVPHHIKQVKPSKPEYSDEKNIVVLCRKCHKKYHKKYKKVNQKTFAEYVIKRNKHNINLLEKENKELKLINEYLGRCIENKIK